MKLIQIFFIASILFILVYFNLIDDISVENIRKRLVYIRLEQQKLFPKDSDSSVKINEAVIKYSEKTVKIDLEATSLEAPKEAGVESNRNRIFKIYEWMPNNNVMQYSSYIFKKHTSNKTSLWIRGIIVVNTERLDDHNFKNSSFICILKSIETGLILEIAANNVISLIHQRPKKIYCDLDNLESLKIEDISIAFIRKGDFIRTIDTNNWTSEKKMFPYYMINFQIPRIVDLPQKKIKNIAMCTQFCYSLPLMLTEWVSLHEKLNISQIVVYDSTENYSLTDFINRKSLNHVVEVRPYFLNKTKTCNIENFYFIKNFSEISAYTQVCNGFVENIKFEQSRFHTRLIHHDVSANDCYTTESEKYELIAVYDFDEIVFPRRIDDTHVENKKALSCNSTQIYSNTSSFIPYTLYDYSLKLVSKHMKSDEITKLSTIYFDSALYLPVNANIADLMNIIKATIYNLNSSLPTYVYLRHGKNKTHPFEIKNEDIEFTKTLVKEYESFECLYQKYKDKLLKVYPNLLRFLYLMHEVKSGIQLPYKGIHYTDNVRALYAHGAIDIVNNSIYFFANIDEGHFLTHFRFDPSEYFDNNVNGSIRKLKIDKDYLNYLIQKYCI